MNSQHPTGPPSFTCPVCDTTSHHPEDVEHGYCGKCHRFTRAEENARRALAGLQAARRRADGHDAG